MAVFGAHAYARQPYGSSFSPQTGGGTTLTVDGSASVEFLGSVLSDRRSPLEWLLTAAPAFTADANAVVEWLGQPSVVAVGSGSFIEWARSIENNYTPFEWSGQLRVDGSPSLEWPFTNVGVNAGAYAEWIVLAYGDISDLSGAVEWSTDLISDVSDGIEWQLDAPPQPVAAATYIQWPALVAAVQNYMQDFDQPAELPDSATLTTIASNAELRIYRELDFLATKGVNRSLSLTSYSRTLDIEPMTGQAVAGLAVTLPYPIIVDGITILVTKGSVPAMDEAGNIMKDESGNIIYTSTGFVRTRLQRCSLAMVDSIWPDETAVGTPGQPFGYYAMLDHTTAVIAPTPDKSYQVEVVGTWRPAPMSPANPRTWLGDNLPDLLIAAVMVEVCGYQRNYGAQSEDPKVALSWESRYTTLRQGAMSEEMRRKAIRPPPPVAH